MLKQLSLIGNLNKGGRMCMDAEQPNGKMILNISFDSQPHISSPIVLCLEEIATVLKITFPELPCSHMPIRFYQWKTLT